VQRRWTNEAVARVRCADTRGRASARGCAVCRGRVRDSVRSDVSAPGARGGRALVRRGGRTAAGAARRPAGCDAEGGANMKQEQTANQVESGTKSMKRRKAPHAQDMSSHIAANSLHGEPCCMLMRTPHRPSSSRRCLTVSRQTRMLCAPGEASPPGTHSVRGARCARAEGVGRRAAGRLSAYLLLQPAPLVSAVCEGTRVAWVERSRRLCWHRGIRLRRRCGV